jgi:ADP-L-glycero-D-manno-heptose 6-epimerase
MNIVTGYRGFIGSHLFKQIENAYGVEQHECFDFLYNFNQWDEVKCVYHLGAISDTTEIDIDKIYKYNIKFTLQLLQRCIDYGIPVKYASSASVYGNLYPNINPLNYYSMSKATVDYWVEQNKKQFSSIQGYRFFNVYGKNEDHKSNQASPVHQFTRQALTNGVIRVFRGSENFYRDFVCVNDVMEVMQMKKLSGIYDVGTSNPISFRQVAELVAKKYSAKIIEIEFPKHLIGKYQYHTRAKQEFDYDFMTVKQWLD